MEIMASGIHLGTVLLCLVVQAEHIGCSWNQASESGSKGRDIYRYAGLSRGARVRVGDNGVSVGDGSLAQNQFRAASIVSAPGWAQRDGDGSGSIHRGDAANGGSIHRGDPKHSQRGRNLQPNKAKGHHWKRFGFGLSTDIGSGANNRASKLQQRKGFTPLKGISNQSTRERSAHTSKGLASRPAKLFQASHQPPAQEKTKAVHPALIRTGPPANSGRKPASLFQGDFSTDLRRPSPSSVADVKVAPRSFREQSVNVAPRSFPGGRKTSGQDVNVSWGTSSVKVIGQRVPSQQGSSQMSQTMSARSLYAVPPIRRQAAQRALKAEEYTVSSGQINFVRSADLLPPSRGPAQHGPSTVVHNIPENLGGFAIRRDSANKPQPTRPASYTAPTAMQGPPQQNQNSDWMTIWPRPVTEARGAGMPQPTRALYIKPPTPPPSRPIPSRPRPQQQQTPKRLTTARPQQQQRPKWLTTARPQQQQRPKWLTTARPQQQQKPKWFTIKLPLGATFP